VQVLGGRLLLFGFFVPLALTLLAAELYNMLAFHLVFVQYRESFEGIFSAKPATQP